MKSQDSTDPIAALHHRGGQNHFIQHASAYSKTVNPGGNLGLEGIDHSVFVFDANPIEGYPVVLTLRVSGFSTQEYLTASEARVLANALLMAADYAEDQQRARTIAESSDWLSDERFNDEAPSPAEVPA